MTTKPSWYESFRAALLETDCTTIDELILAAEFEIHKRQHLLAEGRTETPTERYALAKAMNSLRGLREDLVWWQNRRRQEPAENSNANSEFTIAQRRYRKHASESSAVPMYLVAGRAGF
jgi:hypothetical protein